MTNSLLAAKLVSSEPGQFIVNARNHKNFAEIETMTNKQKILSMIFLICLTTTPAFADDTLADCMDMHLRVADKFDTISLGTSAVTCEQTNQGSFVLVEFTTNCTVPTDSYLLIEAVKGEKGTTTCRSEITTESFCSFPLPPESYVVKGKDGSVWRKVVKEACDQYSSLP